MALLDRKCRGIVDKNPNMLIPWFLMACYAYDVLDTPILTDGHFDHLGHLIQLKWNTITHRHKDLILNMSEIWKPSCVNVAMSELPMIVKDTAVQLVATLP